MEMKELYKEKKNFKFINVDKKWKFSEMIELRDEKESEKGFEIMVNVKEKGVSDGIGNFKNG